MPKPFTNQVVSYLDSQGLLQAGFSSCLIQLSVIMCIREEQWVVPVVHAAYCPAVNH